MIERNKLKPKQLHSIIIMLVSEMIHEPRDRLPFLGFFFTDAVWVRAASCPNLIYRHLWITSPGVVKLGGNCVCIRDSIGTHPLLHRPDPFNNIMLIGTILVNFVQVWSFVTNHLQIRCDGYFDDFISSKRTSSIRCSGKNSVNVAAIFVRCKREPILLAF